MAIENKCPACGKKLSIFYLKQECPYCHANLLYYNIEERLERDAEKAEAEYAKLDAFLDKLKRIFHIRSKSKEEPDSSSYKEKSKEE